MNILEVTLSSSVQHTVIWWQPSISIYRAMFTTSHYNWIAHKCHKLQIRRNSFSTFYTRSLSAWVRAIINILIFCRTFNCLSYISPKIAGFAALHGIFYSILQQAILRQSQTPILVWSNLNQRPHQRSCQEISRLVLYHIRIKRKHQQGANLTFFLGFVSPKKSEGCWCFTLKMIKPGLGARKFSDRWL